MTVTAHPHPALPYAHRLAKFIEGEIQGPEKAIPLPVGPSLPRSPTRLRTELHSLEETIQTLESKDCEVFDLVLTALTVIHQVASYFDLCMQTEDAKQLYRDIYSALLPDL